MGWSKEGWHSVPSCPASQRPSPTHSPACTAPLACSGIMRSDRLFAAHLVSQAVGCVCPRCFDFLVAGQIQLSLVGKHEHSALHKGGG